MFQRRFGVCLSVIAIVLGGVHAAMPREIAAQTFKVEHVFNTTTDPQFFLQVGALPQGRNGSLYGISHFGGSAGNGTVYSVTPSGTVAVLASLTPTTGDYPYSGLTLGTDGNFYGSVPIGGGGGNGALYKVTPGGTLTTLHAFTNTGDGQTPIAPPAQAADGNYYGFTQGSVGTFYKITPAGVFSTLHTLTSAEGSQCSSGNLLLGSDGSFYTGCNYGGANNLGTLIRVTTAGTVTVLHDFTGTDGLYAANQMVQGADGNFYGVTYNGGTGYTNTNLANGVFFQLKPSGAYKVLYNFTGGSDGGVPDGGLVLGPDGKFYGTNSVGGNTTACSGGCGTIFSLTTAGLLTTLHSFAGTDGDLPSSNLTLSTNGKLYGVTTKGGSAGNGVFFSLDMGFSPFVSLQQTSGRVGAKIGILGQGFSASSVVKFNGVTATTVTRTGTTFLLATVPTGATNGFVTVTTGANTLKSSKKFIVHNSWSSAAVMPTAREGVATGVINGKVYVISGATASAIVGNNEVYNPATNTWTTGAAIPKPVFIAASAVVKNILYVMGGIADSSQTPQSAVQAYDPSTNTWKTKAPMPTANDSANAVVLNNLIYVVGGYDGSRSPLVQVYNPATDTWSTASNLLVAKSGSTVGVLGTKIVSSGGLENNGNPTGDTEGYNSGTDSWSVLTADTTPRNGACGTAVLGQLYVTGGSTASVGGSATAVTEVFNLTKNAWTTLLPVPLAVINASPAVANGQMYCFGGTNDGRLFNGSVYNNVQIYQP